MSARVNDGGRAFPFNAGEFGIEPSGGMSLRDWFAGQALVGILAQSNGSALKSDQVTGARWAYQMADAMLAAREPRP